MKLTEGKRKKIRNERDAIADTAILQNIVRNYYEQLYTNKMDKREEINSKKHTTYQD